MIMFFFWNLEHKLKSFYLWLVFLQMGPKKAKTRHNVSCFGPPTPLPDVGSLFTFRDILAAVEMLKISDPNESNWGLCCKLTPKVKAKWAETNPLLVVIQDQSISRKIQLNYETATLINQARAKAKVKKLFIDKLDTLFDILVCQCPIICCDKSECNKAHCQDGAHITCSCPRQVKIPPMELKFILDQRKKVGLKGGLMVIAGADRKEAERQAKSLARKQSEVSKEPAIAGPSVEDIDIEDINNNEVMDIEDDEEFIEKNIPSNQNRTDLSDFVAEVIRYGISDRAAAALYNGALKTIGAITENETNLIVDQAKIRRSRDIFAARQKNIRKEKRQGDGGIKCFGSDGKRNKKTRVLEVEIVNGEPKEKYSMKAREHIVYTTEPGGEYLCHSEVLEGTGRDLANDFVDVIAEHESLDSIVAVLADGTNTNTGWKEGMIAHTERDLQKTLLWLICQLHGNELGLRHYFEHCDGGFGTSGPDSFNGPIGKAVKGELHLLDTVEFDKIETSLGDLEDSVWKDLSCDQQLLYRWTKAIAVGVVPADLACRVAGPINHSRWLTLAIRLMQLYTVTPNPSDGLQRAVRYIIQVYVPGWFQIKCHSKFTFGPLNLFHQMCLTNTQPLETQSIVKKVLQRNAYFADPGVLLVSMLESDQKEARTKAVNIVNVVRASPPKPPRAKCLRKMRKFQIPPLNWDAEVWWEIIDWSKVVVFEPALLSEISNDELFQSIQAPLNFPNFPCHSQSVERAVKLVTEAAFKVCGADRRHNHIVSVLASRKARKPFKSKKHYKYSSMDK